MTVSDIWKLKLISVWVNNFSDLKEALILVCKFLCWAVSDQISDIQLDFVSYLLFWDVLSVSVNIFFVSALSSDHLSLKLVIDSVYLLCIDICVHSETLFIICTERSEKLLFKLQSHFWMIFTVSEEQSALNAFWSVIVDCKFCREKSHDSVILQVDAVSLKILLHNTVDSFSLIISLRMKDCE